MKELLLMCGGNKPQAAIYLLYKYNILDACLKYDNEEALLNAVNLSILLGYILENKIYDIEYKTLYIDLLALPYRKFKIKVGKDEMYVSEYIIKESLKLPNDYIREIKILSENIEPFMKYVEENNYDRLTCGKLIRKIKGVYVQKLIIISICESYVKDNSNSLKEELNIDVLSSIIKRYKNFENYLEKENLLNIDNLKPLYDGNEIQKLLQIKKGKEIGILMEALIEEQIKSPEMDHEQASIFLKIKRKEIENLSDINKKKK
jgi:tRNA nucleotidyltransferase/poly(A) polymerase